MHTQKVKYPWCISLTKITEKLQLVKFVVRAQLNESNFPKIHKPSLAEHAAGLNANMCVIDDQTALRVTSGDIEVISEGTWRLFNDKR